MPCWARFFMTSSTSPTISGSSAEVGSSKSMISGSMHSARAMATRCFCPPERRRESAWMKSARPTVVKCLMAVASACVLGMCLTSMGARVQLSSTDLLLKRLKPWNTMPIFWRRAFRLTLKSIKSCPSNQMWPESASSSKLMQRSSVDLPEPDAPMMHTTSPRLTSRSMPLSTCRSPKDFSSCSILMMGSFVIAPSCQFELGSPRSTVWLPWCRLVLSGAVIFPVMALSRSEERYVRNR